MEVKVSGTLPRDFLIGLLLVSLTADYMHNLCITNELFSCPSCGLYQSTSIYSTDAIKVLSEMFWFIDHCSSVFTEVATLSILPYVLYWNHL